jgi:hypothetical protein
VGNVKDNINIVGVKCIVYSPYGKKICYYNKEGKRMAKTPTREELELFIEMYYRRRAVRKYKDRQAEIQKQKVIEEYKYDRYIKKQG